ncbi:MAG: alpha/beta family hydrolase [Myxococcota bacterium]
MDVVWLFAPGAGLPSDSPWMTRWSAQLETRGPVVRFDYPYRLKGRNRPDRLPVLLEHHQRMLAEVEQAHPGRAVVLIGKSMGSRVGCHVATASAVHAVVCLGYPLLGGGNPEKRRDEVLRALEVPIQFVQGTRDRMCPLDTLEGVRAEMRAPSALHIVETGDHSLHVTKTHQKLTGQAQDDVDRRSLSEIIAFIEDLPDSHERARAATRG